MDVDLSEQMLVQAKQKLQAFPHIDFQLATVRSLPFPDHRFNVVISANSFHYFDSPIEPLLEVQRVLKSDGRLVLLDWWEFDSTFFSETPIPLFNLLRVEIWELSSDSFACESDDEVQAVQQCEENPE